MKFLNDSMPWATIMTAVLVGIAAVAGAVVVIRNPSSLDFQQYLDVLKNFAIAVGIVGIGRGIASHGKSTASATLLKDESLVPAMPAAAGANGLQATALSDLNALAAVGTTSDPYADVAWMEAPPPPVPVGEPQTNEI